MIGAMLIGAVTNLQVSRYVISIVWDAWHDRMLFNLQLILYAMYDIYVLYLDAYISPYILSSCVKLQTDNTEKH